MKLCSPVLLTRIARKSGHTYVRSHAELLPMRQRAYRFAIQGATPREFTISI